MTEPENFTLNVEGQLFEATPRNTTLQEYSGVLAIYNNILLETVNEEGETTEASIIFSESAVYPKLRQIIESHHFPMYLNMFTVAEGVITAYVGMNTSDIETIPEDWL